MEAIELVAGLRKRGITLAVEGGNLRVTPASKLTDVERQFIRTHKPVVLEALAKQADGPAICPHDPPVRETSLRQWDAESSALIAFFRAAQSQLPRQPFRLTRWQFISDPDKWYAALDREIAAGPLGVRARMGALQEDLRQLQAAIQEPR